MNYIQRIPTIVLGSLEETVSVCLDEINKLNIKYIGVLIDKNVAEKNIAKPIITELSKLAELIIYESEFSEPKKKHLLEIYKFFIQDTKTINLFLAIGGGSTIDSAKIVSILYKNKDFKIPDTSYKNYLIKEQSLPIIAFPTTTGSGSEISPAAIFSSDLGKTVIVSEKIIPILALISPQLTMTLSPLYTAACAADTIIRSFEGLFSKKHSLISNTLNLGAIRCLMKILLDAVNDISNLNLRYEIAEACLMSSFGSRITGANIIHALALPLEDNYNLSHSISTSLCFYAFIKFLSRKRNIEFESYISKLAPELSLDFFIDFFNKLPIYTSWKTLDLGNPDISMLIERVESVPNLIQESLFNVSKSEIRKIYDVLINN